MKSSLDLLLSGVDMSCRKSWHFVQHHPLIVIESTESLRQTGVDLKKTLPEQDIGIALDYDVAT